MNPELRLRNVATSVFLTSLLSFHSVHAAVDAVDDGSTGSSFSTTDEDTLLDTTGGASVTTNDTGTFTLLGFDASSLKGAEVLVNPDGTFSYDPRTSGAAQALDAAGSLEDTFSYTITETPTLVGGVTSELNATSGVNTGVWNGLSVAVAATGTGVPNLVTAAYNMQPGGTRASYNSAGDTSDASFEFWVKPTVVNADQVLFETGGTGTGSAVVINDDGTVSYVVRGGASGPLIVQSSTVLVAGQWYHIVVTYDRNNPGSTDTASLYVDAGTPVTATKTDADDWSGTDGAGLGIHSGSTAADNTDVDGDGVNETYTTFTGQMAVFRFYSNKVLTPTEITNNRNAILTAINDSATVTVEVTGVNDAPVAHDDVVSTPTALEDGAPVSSTQNLLVNDGPVRYDSATGANEILYANYDASLAATADSWPNIGSLQTSRADLTLTGVTLDTSPGSNRAGITRALDFDDISGGAGVMGADGISGPADFPGSIDQADASFEFWVKLHADDLTQISTLFETGGGTGLGLVVDNGVLKAATGIGIAAVSYDLTTDPLNLLTTPGDPTDEFFQVIFATDLVNNENRLYVNGTQVAVAGGNTVSDWDGGDAAGVGRYGENNHGGFQNGAAMTAYDTYFKGAMAIFRIYGEAFTEGQALQNYKAVNAGTDVDGDSFTVTGIVDASSALQGIGSPATIASGAIVTLDSASGGFTYNPNGAFQELASGVSGTDSFTYRIDDGNGGTSEASVTFTIFGKNDAVDDTIAATEALVTNFKANRIVGNDDHALATSDAFFSVDAASVSGSNWFNIGSGGATYDVNVTGGALVSPPSVRSNFGAIGKAWRNVAGSVTSVQSISGDDATFEVWFKPEPLQTGKQVLLESGGSTNGMSIVFDADANTVVFTIDSGDDALNFIKATATGVVTGEFNQLIAVYDQDDAGQAGADSLALYLNNDPAAVFNATVDGSGINAASLADNWSGVDDTGIGATAGAAALNETLVPFVGDISIVRIYSRKLSTVEMAANYDAVVQKIVNIEGGTTFTTALGATVTLNADGSFDYDATALNSDIPLGDVVQDSFDYTISDGEGGFSTATVTVDVTGVDNSFLAVDDDVSLGANDGPTAFAVLGNDTFTSATVALQTVVSGYSTSFESGTTIGDSGDALSNGWSYLWNAPSDWDGTASVDASTGGFGEMASYQPLKWSGTKWTADGDDDTATGDPSSFLRLEPNGGHPGLGSTSVGSNGNSQARGPIAAYGVPAGQGGYYGIANSILSRIATTNDAVSAELYVEDMAMGSYAAAPGGSISFDTNLGLVNDGQSIFVGVSPGTTAAADAFAWDFDLVKLPAADSMLLDIIGTVSTDGTTITYDPGSNFASLKVGQSVLETLTYTMVDGASTSTATLNITVNGVNDAPIGVADENTTPEDASVAGSVLGNDTDIDAGEAATLVVAEFQGSSANLGVELTLSSGAKVTMQAGGSYVYDPNGAFDGLEFGAVDQDTFSYLVQDENGLNASVATTVTITIEGRPNNAQPVASSLTQTTLYPTGLSGVPLESPIVTYDPNSGVFSLVDTLFEFDGAVTVFTDGITPDAGSAFDLDGATGSQVVRLDGFTVHFGCLVTADDISDGSRKVLYEFGGTSNGHGIYLIDGIPHLLVKMVGGPGDVPTGLTDTDWAGDDTVCIPLTAAKLPVGETSDIAVIFSLDQVEYSVNGQAPVTLALTNRISTSADWAGDHSVKIGVGGSGNGAASSVDGLFKDDFTTLEGSVFSLRFWNASDIGSLIMDQDVLTTTLTINPAEGGLSVPVGASFDGTIWTYVGTAVQTTGALSLLEFIPNGTVPVDVAVDVRDGEENGAVPVTGTLTFDLVGPLEQWRYDNYGSTADSGTSADTADGDLDLLVNLLEFGFGTNPGVSDAGNLDYDGVTVTRGVPVLKLDYPGGGGVEFTARFMRRNDHGQPGSVSYGVQFSSDLTDWETSLAMPTPVAVDGDYQLVEVPYPFFLGNGKKARFFRVEVTAQ